MEKPKSKLKRISNWLCCNKEKNYKSEMLKSRGKNFDWSSFKNLIDLNPEKHEKKTFKNKIIKFNQEIIQKYQNEIKTCKKANELSELE